MERAGGAGSHAQTKNTVYVFFLFSFQKRVIELQAAVVAGTFMLR